jgi:four helix bundle protein
VIWLGSLWLVVCSFLTLNKNPYANDYKIRIPRGLANWRELSKEIYPLTFIGTNKNRLPAKGSNAGSCGSAMDNIAEGFERGSQLEFINSLSYSKGEVGELKSQLYRCADNHYISSELFDDLYNKADKLTKKITAFISYLNASKIRGQKFKNRDSS